MTQQKEPFVARWSRLKTEARENRAATRQTPPQTESRPPVEARPHPAVSGARAAKELPPVDSLQGLASEYREFLHSEVDENLRRAALKRLFADPHFNTLDGLDVYIDDYGKSDPIPEAMLRTLEHAKGLIFEREEAPRANVNEAAADASQSDRSDSLLVAEPTGNQTAPKPDNPATDEPVEPAQPTNPGLNGRTA